MLLLHKPPSLKCLCIQTFLSCGFHLVLDVSDTDYAIYIDIAMHVNDHLMQLIGDHSAIALV